MHLLTTFTSLRVLEQTTMGFLDFEPGTPPSCLWPATQSPFCVAQSQLLTGSSSCPPESVDRPAEQSDVDTSIKSYEQEQRDWGAIMGASEPYTEPRNQESLHLWSQNQAEPITTQYPLCRFWQRRLQ